VLQKLLVVVPQSKDHEVDVHVVKVALDAFTSRSVDIKNLPGYIVKIVPEQGLDEALSAPDAPEGHGSDACVRLITAVLKDLLEHVIECEGHDCSPLTERRLQGLASLTRSVEGGAALRVLF